MIINAVRLNDGSRNKKELSFEIGWESLLRNGYMKNDADARVFLFQLIIGEYFLTTLYKWYYSPRELLRYSIRYLMIGGNETQEELLTQVSEPAKEFFLQRFQKEPNWMQMLCLRIIRELERRVVTMPEPSGNVFHGLEQTVKKLARRRKMTYDFYLDEILQRKFKIRHNRQALAYIRRIAAKTRDKTIKAAIKQEIVSLEQEQRKLQKELMEILQKHRASLPPEVAASVYNKTIKKTYKN